MLAIAHIISRMLNRLVRPRTMAALAGVNPGTKTIDADLQEGLASPEQVEVNRDMLGGSSKALDVHYVVCACLFVPFILLYLCVV